MTVDDRLFGAIAAVLAELVDGAGEAGWVLNPRDTGLLQSLAGLSAERASRIPASGGASIAAHADHLRYGLELLNRWSAGEENPFADADYAASWRRTTVDEAAWAELRRRLESEAHRWHAAIARPRELTDTEVRGVIAGVAHVAYHLGAIRQLDHATAGPPAAD